MVALAAMATYFSVTEKCAGNREVGSYGSQYDHENRTQRQRLLGNSGLGNTVLRMALVVWVSRCVTLFMEGEGGLAQ